MHQPAMSDSHEQNSCPDYELSLTRIDRGSLRGFKTIWKQLRHIYASVFFCVYIVCAALKVDGTMHLPKIALSRRFWCIV
jgi:hypothetical protein